jgi:hypothetical protein
MRPRANCKDGAKMQPLWRTRSDRTKMRKTERESDGDTKPLDVMLRLMQRCCDVLADEDSRGNAADRRRIDRALNTAATLARSAAPYYHRRLKPADLAPGEPRKTELIVSWEPPTAEDYAAAELASAQAKRIAATPAPE